MPIVLSYHNYAGVAGALGGSNESFIMKVTLRHVYRGQRWHSNLVDEISWVSLI